MYKFSKTENYEEYEFIGDVVLKMLSTVELFLLKPQFDESSLHIARANIICNANLHRKAILKGIYKYILTRKCD
jgi:dsRNA-specific ribonuclease